jgi:hypothetical protein
MDGAVAVAIAALNARVAELTEKLARLERRIDRITVPVEARLYQDRFTAPHGSAAISNVMTGPHAHLFKNLFSGSGSYATDVPLTTRFVYPPVPSQLAEAYVTGDAFDATLLAACRAPLLIIGDSFDDGSAMYTNLVPHVVSLDDPAFTLFTHRLHDCVPTTEMNTATSIVAHSQKTTLIVDAGGVSSMSYLPLLVFAAFFPRVAFLMLPSSFSEGSCPDLFGRRTMRANTARRADIAVFLDKFQTQTRVSYNDILCPTGIVSSTPLTKNGVARIVADVDSWEPVTDIGKLLRALVLVMHSPQEHEDERFVLQAATHPANSTTPSPHLALYQAVVEFADIVPISLWV